MTFEEMRQHVTYVADVFNKHDSLTEDQQDEAAVKIAASITLVVGMALVQIAQEANEIKHALCRIADNGEGI